VPTRRRNADQTQPLFELPELDRALRGAAHAVADDYYIEPATAAFALQAAVAGLARRGRADGETVLALLRAGCTPLQAEDLAGDVPLGLVAAVLEGWAGPGSPSLEATGGLPRRRLRDAASLAAAAEAAGLTAEEARAWAAAGVVAPGPGASALTAEWAAAVPPPDAVAWHLAGFSPGEAAAAAALPDGDARRPTAEGLRVLAALRRDPGPRTPAACR
jgi:hypothetical protein